MRWTGMLVDLKVVCRVQSRTAVRSTGLEVGKTRLIYEEDHQAGEVRLPSKLHEHSLEGSLMAKQHLLAWSTFDDRLHPSGCRSD